MITVIIPCYNSSQFIYKSVRSLEMQFFKDFEVIIVDDCSIDDTWNVLNRIKKNSPLKISLFQNEVNSGPSISRNLGIDNANTEYITFCDSDDWYEPEFLKEMVYLLESNKADIAFCGYKIVDEKGNSQYRPIYSRTGAITRVEAFGLDADSLCMLMVKTSIMKEALLPNLRNGEDVAIVPLLMAKSQRYAVSEECLYNYFRRQGSTSETPTMKVVESLLSSFQFTKQNFPAKYSKELEFLGVKNVLYSTIITLFSFGYDKDKAKMILRTFEAEFPNWYQNSYLATLRSYKKIVIKLLHYRCFLIIKLIALLRNSILK